MDPVNLALTNQLIFDKIRTFIPKSGPTLRLVCKTWNDQILSDPRRKLVLHLHRHSFRDADLCCDPLTFERFGMSMEPRLATHVRFWTKHCCVHFNSGQRERDQHYKSLMTRFYHLCEKFGEIIETVEILVRSSMLQILYELLTRFCPNLRYLRIREWCVDLSERKEGEAALEWGRLPVRPDLVGLHIGTNKEADEGAVRLREFTQMLVNSAPALKMVNLPKHPDFKDLKIKGNVEITRNMHTPLFGHIEKLY
ncbi:uncharacterized protein LOC110854690 [Folsomia candida]|uniref:F-box domain-containing protein n=1 Tax=Folsomia candida TaxID=158441 RepID=A0A226DZR7_FOLCA|nr:uncharacterized protein LOC110854690 [Folsomia candida]OXA49696.1 hypothetical protein Fcan01_15745 [Folsomia candida]